jgi:hypothetical protein
VKVLPIMRLRLWVEDHYDLTGSLRRKSRDGRAIFPSQWWNAEEGIGVFVPQQIPSTKR